MTTPSTERNQDMRREIVLREINQGALAGMPSQITEEAADKVLAALDTYDMWRKAPERPARPPWPYQAREWMEEGARIECFSGRDSSDVLHEGWIVGLTEAPTVRVQKDDGQIVSWVLGLTRKQVTGTSQETT